MLNNKMFITNRDNRKSDLAHMSKVDSKQHNRNGRFNVSKVLLLTCIAVACLLLVKPSYLYAKSVLAQVLLNKAWLQTQQQGKKHLPWQWADTYPVAKLTFKKEKVSWIVLAGMTGRAMAFGPTWLEDSAKPNQYGNTVISAHNDSHFTVLEKTIVGDKFIIEDNQGKKFIYRVMTINITSSDDVSPYLFQDATMLTLITCYPFEITSLAKKQRLVVQAMKVEHQF